VRKEVNIIFLYECLKTNNRLSTYVCGPKLLDALAEQSS
jgi:hypothetical protein